MKITKSIGILAICFILALSIVTAGREDVATGEQIKPEVSFTGPTYEGTLTKCLQKIEGWEDEDLIKKNLNRLEEEKEKKEEKKYEGIPPDETGYKLRPPREGNPNWKVTPHGKRNLKVSK